MSALPEPIPAEEQLPVQLSEFPDHVTRWSGIEFDRPVPLVSRWDIRPGDYVQSSHGIRFRVTDVYRTRHPATGERNATVYLKGNLWDRERSVPWTEASSGSIPLIERQGVCYLEQQ